MDEGGREEEREARESILDVLGLKSRRKREKRFDPIES